MALKLFNTISRSIQEFAPLNPPKVGMYCCGPTVYDFAHIGNWRTFVFADLVRRTLEFFGYKVKHVMNITDVDDKIIKRVRETKTPLREFTRKYESAFLLDLQTLNCKEPNVMPRATEHIPEIIALIEKLVARGIAYKAADGSVYFSIAKYRASGGNYGQLLKLNFDELRVGERVASDEYDKESVADFALWKARTPEDGDVFWKSDSLGEGRPGWHIECSAMSMKALGETFDLHIGGEDLKFPHHEDEIAQSEGATGKPFVKFWLHGAHLLVEGKKMSKSLGNYHTLPGLTTKDFEGPEIRYLLLSAHYRETFNFTMDGLHGARKALARIDECVSKLRELAGNVTAAPDEKFVERFSSTLADDLNISAAWGEVFKWVTETNKRIAGNSLSGSNAASALAAWEKINSVLGIASRAQVANPTGSGIGISVSLEGGSYDLDLNAALEARGAARRAKDFKRADAIRDELKAKGWTIDDTPKGPKLKKL